MTALDPAPVELLSAAVDGALWCDPAGVIRSGELDVTDQVKEAEGTGLLLLGVDGHGNEVWIPSRFGEWVLRRAAAETMPVRQRRRRLRRRDCWWAWCVSPCG